MTQEPYKSEPDRTYNGENSRYIIEQLRERMVSADRQRERAVELQAESYERALERQRENQEQHAEETERMLSNKIEAAYKELLVRIENIRDAGDKLALERDRAAEALRSATQKAIEQADVERAKSADRLAEQLKDKIKTESEKTDAVQRSLHERVDEGDAHLRQHIDQQVVQIQQAIEAARRETDIIHNSSEKAIQKAEIAADKRFEGVNKFREQLNDQSKDFMPRELADSQFEEFRKQITDLQRTESSNMGRDAGSDKTTALLIAVSTLVLGAVVVIANIFV